jgi:hypothetical protein
MHMNTTLISTSQQQYHHHKIHKKSRRLRWAAANPIQSELATIAATDTRIESTLAELAIAELHLPTSVMIRQRGTVAGITPGGLATFQATPQPLATALPAGTVLAWSVDDSADIAFTPSTDSMLVACACASTPVQASFNLTFTTDFTPPGMAGPVSMTVSVPILA